MNTPAPASVWVRLIRDSFVCLRDRPPRVRVGGSLWIYSEIPHVEIDLFRTQHLHDRILTWWQWLCGSHSYPLTRAQLLDIGGDVVALLRRLPGERDFQVADYPYIALDFGPHDPEPSIEWHIAQRPLVHVPVDRWTPDVRLHSGMYSFQFERVFRAPHRVDGRSHNALLVRLLVELAAVLQDLSQFRLAAVLVGQEPSSRPRQAQPRHDFG